MNEKAEIGTINKEQKVVIDKLEEVLHFLKSVQIKDEDVIVNIKNPLDDLQSSLKYIPTEPFFETIPYEIKTNILNYLCDSNAFIAAAVCLEWKEILASRITEKNVTIGQSCCRSQCRDNICLTPAEMLKASATHKLDVHLSICNPVKEINSKLVTDALTSVSKFSLIGTCTPDSENNDYDDSFESECTPDSENNDYDDSFESECEVNPLSIEQLEDLFKCLEQKDKIMERVKLVCLDLNELNQDRLVHCFLFKIKSLDLRDGQHGQMFNVETLINKLSQESTEFKLKTLTLDIEEFPSVLTIELADALCNVENVKLHVQLRIGTILQLVENIISDTRPVMIKTLVMRSRLVFDHLISPEDLKKLLNKMVKLQMQGNFTSEQLEAAKSLPDVEVWQAGFITFINKDLNFNMF